MLKTSIIAFLAVSLALAGAAPATDFYVSTSGSPTGDGTFADPWDLTTALHHPPAVQPGDTIWVRGGAYSGAHTSLLAGAPGQPITVRAYRRERVVVDYAVNTNCDPGEPDECSPNNKRCNALSIPACSHDVIFRDLELTNSAASARISIPPGGCNDSPECCYADGVAPPLKPECSETPAGIARAQWQPLYVAGDRVKIVNVIVHDGGTGIVADQKAIDTEIYGSLIFNNGWVDPASGQGHGLQIENRSPSWRQSRKGVRNSVVWNNFGDGYRSFTSWGRFSDDLLLEDLVAFNNGAPSAAFYGGDPVLYADLQSSRYGNVLLQADELMRYIQLTRCRLYHPATGNVHRQHFGGVKGADYEFNKDIIVEDSYLATSGTPLSLIRWDRARATGTTLVGGATPAVGDTEALLEMERTDCQSLLVPGGPWNPLDWDDNAYFFTGEGSTPFGFNEAAVWNYYDFAGWRSEIYDRDANSTYSAGLPATNAVFVQPNDFEAGRAHIVVYNWQGLDSVGVDLSSTGLTDADPFHIYNLQSFQNTGDHDYFGNVVASGTYDSGNPVVDIDMTDTSVTAPIGLGYTVDSTLPEFGAFLVRRLPCGDGYIDAGETCDDGNNNDHDDCTGFCTVAVCGDGSLHDQGSGTETCDDSNPASGDGCDASCQTEPGFSCPVPGQSCEDTDECVEGTDDCGANAICTNTPGSFTCACESGYAGDGYTCTDIDECAEGTDSCDPNATCTNTQGSYTCACDSGYVGDGYSCTDVDECAEGTDDCHSNAICTNTPGSFTCACESGYAGDGYSCTDVDECAEGTDDCDSHATCANTPGSFTCTCVPGYAGDGATCSPDGTCTLQPRSCRGSEKSILLIKGREDDAKDKIVWKWIKGEATTQTELADPTTGASYTLCLYAGPSNALIGESQVGASPVYWSPISDRGYRYLDKTYSQDGIQKLLLKGGDSGKAKALVKGRGANLPDPVLPLSLPVTAQLMNNSTQICFEGVFSGADVKKSTDALFKAKY